MCGCMLMHAAMDHEDTRPPPSPRLHHSPTSRLPPAYGNALIVASLLDRVLLFVRTAARVQNSRVSRVRTKG